MGSGQFSELVHFQERTVVPSGGTNNIVWSIGFHEWVEPQRSTETICRFIMRYRKAPGNIEIAADTHRIIWEAVIWNITSAVHDRKYSLLTIDCDFSEAIEATDLQSLVREYIDGVPVIRTRE